MCFVNKQPEKVLTAEIHDMVSLRERPARKRVTTAPAIRVTAKLLSIRQSLIYQATVGVEGIDTTDLDLSNEQLDQAIATVRRLLNAEFGSLRIHRYRQVFTVGHHCVETLMAGLLRVQHQVRQINLPLVPDLDSDLENTGMRVSWGVGHSIYEAENRRLRRQK